MPNGTVDFIEHGELIADAKWALFDVFARLTFDRRIPRERAVAFLERLERDQVFDEDDFGLVGMGGCRYQTRYQAT